MDQIQAVATAAARAGASRAAESFQTDIDVEKKTGKTDVVTEADRAAQAVIIEQLQEQTPDATIIAEEQASTAAIPETGNAWIIDPIDGTYNYTRGSSLWSTSLAYVEDRHPRAAVTIAPAIGDEYIGVNPPGEPATTRRNETPVTVSTTSDPETGLVAPLGWWPRDRRQQYTDLVGALISQFNDLRWVGSTQLTLATVAAGEIDAAVTNVTPSPWDSVAGVALIRWAGGTATDIHGDPWDATSEGLVVSNGELQEEVLTAGQQLVNASPAESSLER